MATNAPSTSMRLISPVRRFLRSRPTSASGSPPATNSATSLSQIDLDMRIGEQPVLQDLLGAEAVAAVDQSDVMAVIGEVERFLDRGVAAADHRHLLAAVEEAVAGRAGRRALPLHMLFGRKAEPLGLGAGGNDERIGKIMRAAVAAEAERPLAEVDGADVVPHHLGADMLGLRLHLLDQPGALDDVAEAGIVLDVGRGGQLAAGLDSLDDNRR